MKAARAVVSRTPGLAQAIAADWQRAARFYARFGISEAQFRHGVRDAEVSEDADLGDSMWSRVDRVAEVRAREAAVLPRVEWSYG